MLGSLCVGLLLSNFVCATPNHLVGLVLAFKNKYFFEEEKWQQYKVKHSKNYAEEEENKRFQIWKENFAMVEKHNEEADEGIHGYRMAVNKYSDLSDEEFESTRLGYVPEKNDEKNVRYFEV